jgi:TatD DNase family protein
VIDSHCHLAGTEFAGDLEAVVARARGAGLAGAMVVLAADDPAELDRAAGVAAVWPEVRFAIGVHPHAAAAFADDPDGAARRTEGAIDAQPLARAVGEIGLDYHYDFAAREVQQAVFRSQLALARRRRLPVVIHTREAEADTLRILAEEGAGEVGGVFHCFTGDAAAAARALQTGLHVSLAGIVTFPRATALKGTARAVPLDRLLVETDSPYLAPVPHRGTRNEPAHVRRVAEEIAGLRGMSLAEVVEATAANFSRLFVP